MQTNQLKRKYPNTKRMIVARGGKRGKTAGRGGKGQSARAGNKRRPEWRDIIKKLPKLRGRGKNSNKSIQTKPAIINLSILEKSFDAGASVTPTILVESGVISTQSGKTPKVKILGDGEITKALKVSGCFVSGSAKDKIEKAGGTIAIVVPITTQKIVVKVPKVKKPATEKAAEAKEALPVKEKKFSKEKSVNKDVKAVKEAKVPKEAKSSTKKETKSNI